MSDEKSGDEFDNAERIALRARYVVDRVDGRPFLQGHGRCPRCEVKMRPKPTGRMELEDRSVRVIFELACPACGRSLTLQEEFEWGP
jgi:uncharacterized protein with PIN domain